MKPSGRVCSRLRARDHGPRDLGLFPCGHVQLVAHAEAFLSTPAELFPCSNDDHPCVCLTYTSLRTDVFRTHHRSRVRGLAASGALGNDARQEPPHAADVRSVRGQSRGRFAFQCMSRAGVDCDFLCFALCAFVHVRAPLLLSAGGPYPQLSLPWHKFQSVACDCPPLQFVCVRVHSPLLPQRKPDLYKLTLALLRFARAGANLGAELRGGQVRAALLLA